MRTDQKLLRQRRQASAILIVGVFVVLISLFFGLGSLSRFRQAEATWEAHNARATAVANALENFNRHTGYGGFIHNFKNLVLRRDLPRYQQRIEADIAGLRADLDLLDTLINAPGEKAALAQLRATFEEYATNYAKVPPMVAAGASSDELDAVVKVDDGPALAALAQLKTHVSARAEQAQQLAQATHADALRFAWIGGGLMMTAILAAILAIVVMMLLQRRIVAANQIIRKTQEHLAEREQQLCETQRIAHLGGWKVDRPSGRLSWTEETFRIFGLPVTAQPSAEQAISYFLPESRQVFEQALNAATQEGESFNLELQMRTAQGELRWLCAQAEGKPEAAGPSVVMGTFQDISERKQAQLAREAAHRQLQTTLDALPDLLFEVDAAGLIVHYHSHRGDLLAAPPEVCIGKRFADFLPPDAAGVCQQAIEEATKSGFSGGATYRLALAHGEHWFELSAAPMQVDASSDQHVIVICRDITERKRAEETLRQSEQRFREMSEAAGAYLWEIDVNMVYTYISNLSVKAKGYTPEDLLGHTPIEFMPEADIATVSAIVDQAIASKSPFKLQHRNIAPSGEVLWEEVNGSPFCNEHGLVVGLRGTGLNITERKQLEDQVHQLAYFDALTGLPNRRMLDDHLHQAIAISKRSGLYGALMFMDLDNFKPLNDAHGHGAGDLLLIEVAKRLSACVREVDTVARLGGDEFVVVLAELTDDKAQSTEQAMSVAEKIRASLAAPYQLMVTQAGEQEKSVEYHCSASIGVVLFVSHEASQTDLMKWADAAMYQTKKAGRNKVGFYHPPAASLNTSS